MSKNKSLIRAWKKQARMLVHENRLHEAHELYLRICKSAPADKEVWTGLSSVSRLLGALQEAEQAARHILQKYPDDADVLHVLGAALNRQQKMAEAIACYRQALQFNPDNAETRYFLANALRETGAIADAETEYNKVLALQPDHLHALNNLSALLTNRGKIQRATELLARALKTSPDSPQLLINYGRMNLHAGDAAKAQESFRQAIAVEPGMVDAHSNFLCSLNYLADLDPASIFEEHLRWAKVHVHGNQVQALEIKPEPLRRLRVAYVSPDLCEHSVARFLEPVLREHDSGHFDIVCYSDVSHPDEMTARFRRLCTHWRDTRELTHEQLAGRIQQDRIDILVDLAGHTAHNRLPVFAKKPAPVQVTWLGYPNTTGISEMDYRLTDALADPPGMTESLHTEALVRLPQGFLCYQCPDDAPDVAPVPSLSTGYITFGSFNNLAKTTPGVVRVWSDILTTVADSRLLLKSRATGDSDVRQRLLGLFASMGVMPGQIEFHDPVPSYEGHMAAYNKVDIGLDTFPYAGTTTTCEALWMGVPVISLAGQTHVARVGVSLLTQVKLEQLIAADAKSYVSTAVQLARNTESLVSIRARLRETMEQSSLCDARGFTRNLEKAMRAMWVTWCNARH